MSSWLHHLLVTALVIAPFAFVFGGAGVIASVIDRPIVVDSGSCP